jgi:hypothetical protein
VIAQITEHDDRHVTDAIEKRAKQLRRAMKVADHGNGTIVDGDADGWRSGQGRHPHRIDHATRS